MFRTYRLDDADQKARIEQALHKTYFAAYERSFLETEAGRADVAAHVSERYNLCIESTLPLAEPVRGPERVGCHRGGVRHGLEHGGLCPCGPGACLATTSRPRRWRGHGPACGRWTCTTWRSTALSRSGSSRRCAGSTPRGPTSSCCMRCSSTRRFRSGWRPCGWGGSCSEAWRAAGGVRDAQPAGLPGRPHLAAALLPLPAARARRAVFPLLAPGRLPRRHGPDSSRGGTDLDRAVGAGRELPRVRAGLGKSWPRCSWGRASTGDPRVIFLQRSMRSCCGSMCRRTSRAFRSGSPGEC